jgi:hypothetical protein
MFSCISTHIQCNISNSGGTSCAITIPLASKKMIGAALILDFDFLAFSGLGE